MLPAMRQITFEKAMTINFNNVEDRANSKGMLLGLKLISKNQSQKNMTQSQIENMISGYCSTLRELNSTTIEKLNWRFCLTDSQTNNEMFVGETLEDINNFI
jgi:hypothetical protein